MSAGSTIGNPSGVPRAFALLAGTIAFAAVLISGIAGGEGPTALILRAGGAGIGVGILGLAAGALGVAVLREEPRPPPVAGADKTGPPAASRAEKTGPPPPAPRPAKTG
jgi:hypothetical protein